MRGVVICLAAAGILATTASAEADAVKVIPGRGSPRTHFVVTFTVPTAKSGYGFSRYVVSASGPSRRHCASSIQIVVPAARRGQRVGVTLTPPGRFHTWCRGAYTGSVSDTMRPVCAPRMMCPMFLAMVSVGRFKFRVS